jgi:putative SOS response-associated peptidase YedK
MLLLLCRWGLVPSFTKPGSHLDFYRQFNARSESVAEKPVFSRLLSRHRCVVLLEGFYEWKADAGTVEIVLVGCWWAFCPPL